MKPVVFRGDKHSSNCVDRCEKITKKVLYEKTKAKAIKDFQQQQ